MKVLEVKELKKSFKEKKAVDGISFTVEKGTIFGMIGPNGAGKTTTIESIIGIKKRDSGSVSLLGFDPLKDTKELYSRIGVQLQETSYQDKIKVKELLKLFQAMYESPIDYMTFIKRFSLEEKMNSYVDQLSGGQRQKLAIILALMPDPEVVFLDELTTGLDPKSRRDMWSCIKSLKKDGKTVIMTTHYMEEATYLCDHIGIVDDGKLIAYDTVEGIIEKSQSHVVLSFETKDGGKVSETLNQDGKQEFPHIDIKEINEGNSKLIQLKIDKDEMLTHAIILLSKAGISMEKLNIHRPNLEDVYLKLTGKQWKESE